MNTSKVLTLALAASLAALVAGCDNKPAVQPLPEVNDANCAPEKIAAMPKAQQQEFSSLCLRRGDGFKPSPKKEW